MFMRLAETVPEASWFENNPEKSVGAKLTKSVH